MDEQKIQSQHDELETILETSMTGIAVTDRNLHITRANGQQARMLDCEVKDLIGTDCQNFLDPSDVVQSIKVFNIAAQKGHYENFERYCTTFKGNRKWLNSSIALMPDRDHFLVTTVDNTELKHAMEVIRDQSVTDELTRIGNRKAFNEKRDILLDTFQKKGNSFSLFIFDIDRFKVVNDTYGHLAGDKVLISLSDVVKSQLSSTDFLYRIGGEEFAILLIDTDMDHSLQNAEMIRTAVEQSVKVNGEEAITVSIGVAVVSPGDTADSMFKRADDNLYRAKREGRNRVIS